MDEKRARRTLLSEQGGVGERSGDGMERRKGGGGKRMRSLGASSDLGEGGDRSSWRGNIGIFEKREE